MKMYVGNLSFNCTEDQIREIFAPHGEVATVSIVTDRDTGQSRGFGFVEMTSDSEAQAAITALHGQSFLGRNLTVNEARPKTGGGGGYGGGGGGGGGGRGGYSGSRGGGGGGGGRSGGGDRGRGGW